MTVKELMEANKFAIVNQDAVVDKEMTGVFCCDLLSIAMSKAKQGCVWVTVMANINTLAVATLVEAACIILAEGTRLDEVALSKARKEGIPVFCTDLPIFESAQIVAQMIK